MLDSRGRYRDRDASVTGVMQPLDLAVDAVAQLPAEPRRSGIVTATALERASLRLLQPVAKAS